MKKIKIILFAIPLLGLLAFWGCDFRDIGKDDNGNDISLLRIGLPVPSDGTYSVNFVDYSTKAIIENSLVVEPMHFKASGISDLSQVLVTDACKVNHKYFTSSGLLSLNLNPNIKLSQSNMVGFMFAAEEGSYGGSGFENMYISVPRVFKQTSPGHRIINVDMVNTGTQSSIPAISGVTVTGGQLVAALPGINNGNGYDYVGLYKSTSSNISVSANSASYESWGIYQYKDDIWVAPQSSKIVSIGEYFFVVVKKKNVVEGALNINITSASTVSATFKYVITTQDGQEIKGVISGKLPIKTSIEQIFVSSLQKGATITLSTSAPFEISNPTATIDDLTVAGGANIRDFNVTVNDTPGGGGTANDFTLYNLNVIIGCKNDNAVTYAMTKEFQFSLGSKDIPDDAREWTYGHLVSGKSSVYMHENELYTFRVMVDNKWYKYDITTDPSKIDEVLKDELQYIDKYEMKKSGSTWTINAQISSNNFCDL